jgi:hypothetical protein
MCLRTTWWHPPSGTRSGTATLLLHILRRAVDGGFLRNPEDRRGRPGHYIVGEPRPDHVEVLPDPDQLATTPAPAAPPAGVDMAAEGSAVYVVEDDNPGSAKDAAR